MKTLARAPLLILGSCATQGSVDTLSVRLMADGSVDTTYGNQIGTTHEPLYTRNRNTSVPGSLVVRADDRWTMLHVAQTTDSPPRVVYSLERRDSDGQLLSNKRLALTAQDSPSTDRTASHLALALDNKYYVTISESMSPYLGRVHDVDTTTEFYQQPDDSFHATGSVKLAAPVDGAGMTIQVQRGGKIVVITQTGVARFIP